MKAKFLFLIFLVFSLSVQASDGWLSVGELILLIPVMGLYYMEPFVPDTSYELEIDDTGCADLPGGWVLSWPIHYRFDTDSFSDDLRLSLFLEPQWHLADNTISGIIGTRMMDEIPFLDDKVWLLALGVLADESDGMGAVADAGFGLDFGDAVGCLYVRVAYRANNIALSVSLDILADEYFEL